jgi:hypothetical protein
MAGWCVVGGHSVLIGGVSGMKAFRLILAVAIALGAASAFARTWTDTQGRQIQGKFVRYHDGNVVILRGGKAITVPFESLSDADQQYVRKELKAKGLEDLLSSPEEMSRPLDADGKLPTPGAERTWTSNDGKQIRARLVGILNDQVTLLYQEREVTLPLSRLSAADQEYVNRQKAKRQKKAEPARANPQPVAGNPQPVARNPMPRPQWSPPWHGPRTPPPMNPSPTPGWGGPPVPSAPSQPPYTPPSNPQPYTPSYTPPQQQPRIPDYSPGFPQPGPQRQVWLCSHCRRELPTNVGVGSKCPYCGTYLAYEQDASGKITRTAPVGSIGRIVVIGALVPIGAVLIGLLIRFLK